MTFSEIFFFSSFFSLLAILITGFVVVASPYGWPQKSFLVHVPSDVQTYLSFFAVAIYLLPILVSGVFFVLLVWPKKQQIEPETDLDQPGPRRSFEDIVFPATNECSFTCSESLRSKKPTDSIDLSDYNQILKDVGLPYDSSYQDHSQERNEVADPFPILQSIASPQMEFGGLEASYPTEERRDSTSTSTGRVSRDLTNSIPNVTVKSRKSAERTAALRSLKTNLSITIIFCFTNLFLLIPSKTLKMYFCVISTSLLRALLPISTTVANFGTIRSVALKFLELMVYNLLG